MANEVINESEETGNTETLNSEETNTNASVETPTEETPATTEEQAVSGEQITPTETADAPKEKTAEPQNSGEEDFGSILEKFEQEQIVYHSGELVEGTIVGVSERGVLIDFGYKSEGIAPIEDFTSPTGEITVEKGDTVETIIKSISSGDAPPMLSRADAISRKSWDIIEKAFNEESPIIGHVVEVTKGGLRVDLDGVEAFLPGSQADSRPLRNLDSFVGKDIEAKVIKFSRKRNNIVLSRKVITDEVVNKEKAETLGNIEEGYIIEGTVKNLTDYGAFVDIGGIDGLLHVTDMSWGRLQNPGDQFKVSDVIQVKVLKLDKQKEKVALGYKQLIPDPWSTVVELYPTNAKIKGMVSSVTDYGAFIELEPGVEGLVHVSEMSWSKRSVSPKKLLHSGEEVEVQVLGVDTVERRISLGMKQLQPNPWQTVQDRYQIGQRVSGKVRNLTDFGAFVEIEDGIDGLVHVSDISHSKKIKHPKDALKRDQEVEAVIRNIDVNNRRMSLSIKDLTPSAWDNFVATHKPGDTVRGKISRYTGFGVFVELGNELEGLCHISELSDERVERPEDIGAIGQEMDFKILRIEQDTQKIGLSARAVGKENEPMVDSKSYSTEAKGGMASLGELMNLKRGGATEEETKEEQPRVSKKERKALQAQERAEQERLAAEPEQNAETEAANAASAESETAEAVEVSTDTSEAQSTEEINAENEEVSAPSGETSSDTSAEVTSIPEVSAKNQTENTESKNTAIAETSEAAAESAETDTETKGASDETTGEETTTAETVETETVSQSEAKDESRTTEVGETETPEMTDTDGEAASAVSDSDTTDSGQSEITQTETVETAENSKSEETKSAEESEEKTANG